MHVQYTAVIGGWMCSARHDQEAERCNKATRGQPMENSEQKEQENPTNFTGHHPATHPATTRIKKNRRFVRISNRREWKLKKKIQKEIERGKKTVLNLSNKHYFKLMLTIVFCGKD